MVNADRYATAIVTICCLLTVGAAAGTLNSTVSTDPDDAVDLDTRLLPIGTDDLVELDRKINQERREDAGDDGASSADETVDAASSETGERSDGGARDGDAARSERQAAAGGASQSGSGGSAADAVVETVAPPSLLDLLLDLLPLLIGIGVAGALAAAAARRLRRRGEPDDGRSSAFAAHPGDPAPSNDVSRAWFEMVRRLGLDGEYAKTPSEQARAATRRGADPEAATSLTQVFEDVRYGGAPVTEERRRRARRRLEELRSQPERDRGVDDPPDRGER